MSEQPPAGGPDQPGWQPPPPPPAPPYGQPAYQQPQYGQPGYYAPPPAPTPGKATAALVMGIVGMLCCPLVFSVPAWIVGHGAVKEIDASNGALGGRSTANAGYITGIIGTVLGVVYIVAFALLASLGSIDCHSTDNSTNGNTDFSFHCS
ncbi:MAG: DUF4190 domain-containing protein [Marmoricola sp.]